MKNNIIKILPIIWLGNYAMAAGFQSSQTSVADLGYAYAGSASSTEDTSVVYNNPAGMAFRDKDSAQASLYYLDNSIQFTNNGSQITGPDSDGGTQLVVPNLYLHKKYDGFDLGLSINAPFGSNTEYDENWVGRYNAIESELKVPNIGISVAKKINNRLSIGGGINHQKADIALTRAVDYNKLGFGDVAKSDGKVRLEGDGTDIGYNLGLMYKIGDDANIGLTYRSKTKFDLTGKADFTEPDNLPPAISNALAAQGLLQDTNISSSLTLPAQLSVGFNKKLNPKTTFYSNLSWTDWSVMKELDIDFASNNPNSKIVFNWQDTYKIAAGIGYQYNEKLKLRFGVASDESAGQDDTNRVASIPGGRLNWVSAGASYHYNKDLQIDAAIAHVNVAGTNSNTVNKLIGRYQGDSIIVGIQTVWKL